MLHGAEIFTLLGTIFGVSVGKYSIHRASGHLASACNFRPFTSIYYRLVVWNIFSHWEYHHPNWLPQIFQRGGEKPPTSYTGRIGGGNSAEISLTFFIMSQSYSMGIYHWYIWVVYLGNSATVQSTHLQKGNPFRTHSGFTPTSQRRGEKRTRRPRPANSLPSTGHGLSVCQGSLKVNFPKANEKPTIWIHLGMVYDWVYMSLL